MALLDGSRRAIAAALAHELLDAFFPRRCLVCSAAAPDGVACKAHRLPRAPSGARCSRCAAALPLYAHSDSVCARCRATPPGWKRLVVLAEYGRSPALRDWTLAFKHSGRVDLAQPLGRALANRLRACAELDAEDDVLVPVPLHFWRRVERGYDQARELAVEAARGCELRVARSLKRSRHTAAQGSFAASSRTANVRGAILPARRARRAVEGRRVWLVDDVVTSGATAAECARALRRAGAREVNVLALARSVLD